MYTYTKDLAERYIERYRGDVRTVISRPSGIIACAMEPLIGWTDTVSAGGAVGFPLAMGIQRNFHSREGPADVIPADIVSNAILAITAHAGRLPTPELTIFHMASSVAKPVRINTFWRHAAEYLAYSPFKKGIADPGFTPWENETMYDIAFYLEAGLKLDIMEKISELPLVGNKKNLELIKKYKKARKFSHDLGKMLHDVISTYVRYDCSKLQEVIKLMSPTDKEQFFCDVREVDMEKEG